MIRYIILPFLLFPFSLQAQRMTEKEVELGHQLLFCNEPAIAVNPQQPQFQIIAANKNHVFHSRNGGRSFRHQRVESTLGVFGDPVLLYDDLENCYFVHLSNDKTQKWPESFDQIVVQKSSNNGKTWNDGVGIGKNGKMQDKAWISFDAEKTSPYYGHLYVTWTQFDRYNSKNPQDSSRILFSYSKDRGETFSTPTVISDQSGDCRDGDETVEGATTCTGPKGQLYALWAARQQLFLDASLDGGKTWGTDRSILPMPDGWDLDVPDFLRTNGLPFLHADQDGTLFACTAYRDAGFHKVCVILSEDEGHTWSEPLFLQQEDSAHYMMPHAFLDKTSGNYAVLYYKVKNGLVNVLLSYRKKGATSFHTVRLNQYAFPVPGKQLFFGDYINVCVVGNIVAATWTETKGVATVVKTRRISIP